MKLRRTAAAVAEMVVTATVEAATPELGRRVLVRPRR
jgi:hypothetical protein